MKLQELNQNEMTEINGGGLFGNSDAGNQGGLSGVLGLGSLLALTTETQEGGQGLKLSLSVGNGTSLNLGGIFNSLGA